MKIEQAIKSSFVNDNQKAMVNVLYTAAWVGQRQQEFFKPFKITLAQYNVLRILKGQHPNPISVAEVINRMIDKSSNASRIIDRLEKRRLVTRHVCKKDRRQVDVLISSEGLKLLEEMNPSLQTMEQSLIGLNATELTELNNLLDKFRNQKK
ncbi:MAG: DNA-binding MarR family transcriptional regulator [Flavobacteriales bacterium]|jgi:DNA-binding MarR family transcriptional regulator